MEGALQETDSILQRMRTLAVQSANGSYQDDVDREAMQLEFDQLNDELNQIADTDFNGTVMLNGGQMADGLKAIDGKFDYANYERSAKQLGSADINKIDSQVFNDTDTTNGTTKADKVWANLNSAWDRKQAAQGVAGFENGPDSVDVSLKFNAETKDWSVESANNGADKTAITVTKTDNGGYKMTAGGVDFANVIVNTDNLKNGDTMVVTLNNPKAQITAPTNAGAVVTDTSDYTEGTASTAKKTQDLNLTVTLDSTNVSTENMTESINKLFDQLDGASVTAKYTASTATAAGDMSITLKDGTEIKGTADGAFTLKDGTQFWAKRSTAGSIELSTIKADGSAADKKLATISMTQSVATDDGSGSISYKIALEHSDYNSAKLPSVEIKEPDAANVSKSNAFDQSKATMTYADSMTLQVGARTKDAVNFTFNYDSNGLGDLKANLNCSARTDGLGTADLSIADQKSANNAIDKIDNALNKVNMVRATFGAAQNRLEHKISNIDTNTENLTAAESRIRDTQMDKEMMKFTSAQILSQASQSMLAQANSLPQGVLQLLG
jgi:flagellin